MTLRPVASWVPKSRHRCRSAEEIGRKIRSRPATVLPQAPGRRVPRFGICGAISVPSWRRAERHSVLQGRCVGGSTVINGAIVHRLPRAIWDRWGDRQAEARRRIALERHRGGAAESLKRDLQVVAKLASRLERLPMHRALERLGWQHSAIVQRSPCMRHGHCRLLGCSPVGSGRWIDRSFRPRASWGPAFSRTCGSLACSSKVAARSVWKPPAGKSSWRGAAVVIAAGVAHPAFAAGPAVSATSRRLISVPLTRCGGAGVPRLGRGGAPDGSGGLAFSRCEARRLAVPPEMLALRLPVHGVPLRELLARADQLGAWTAVRSDAEGAGRGPLERPRIRFSPLVKRIRFGAAGSSISSSRRVPRSSTPKSSDCLRS